MLTRDHIKLLGIFNMILGGFGLLAAIGMFALFGRPAGLAGLGGLPSDSGGPPEGLGAIVLLIPFAFLLAWVLAFISLAQLLGGWGLINCEPWARILMIVVSALNLLHIPIGTALGVYGLFALLDGKNEASVCE